MSHWDGIGWVLWVTISIIPFFWVVTIPYNIIWFIKWWKNRDK